MSARTNDPSGTYLRAWAEDVPTLERDGWSVVAGPFPAQGRWWYWIRRDE